MPWMEEPHGLQSTGSQRVGHDWVTSLSLLFGHSCQLVLMCVILRTVWHMRCYLVFFPIGSDMNDVEDHLWALIAIWAFCQLVLMSVCCWGPFVNMKCLWAFLPIDADIWPLLRTICKHQCHLGILPIGSDIWLPLRTICVGILTFDYHHGPFIDAPVFLPGESQGRGAWWAAVYRVAQSWTQLKWLSSSSGPFVLGKCLFGTLYWSPLERVYDRSVMWYVALHSICITGTLITLCKMGNSGSVH